MPVTFDKLVNSEIKNKLREIKDHSKYNFHQQWFGAVEDFPYKNQTPKKTDYLKITIEHSTAEYAIENYPAVPRELIRCSSCPDMTMFWTHSALALHRYNWVHRLPNIIEYSLSLSINKRPQPSPKPGLKFCRDLKLLSLPFIFCFQFQCIISVF